MENQTPTPEAPENQAKSPVDRKRRFRFVAWIVGFCLVFSGVVVVGAGIGWITSTTLTINYVDGLISLAIIIAVNYVTGSVVDYNGGFGGLFSRRKGGN